MTFFISFSASFGMILSYLIGALITDWKMNFVVSAVVLVLFAVALDLFCRHLNPIMKWDRRGETEVGQGTQPLNMSTVKLFAISGFFVLIVVAFLRTTLEQAAKTLAPVMLMESYDNISPSVGNLVNLFVLFTGVLGMVLVRKLLYPKRVQNELTGLILTLVFAVPAAGVLLFVGKVGLPVSIAAFCVSCAAYTGSGLFMSFYANCFVKYGKSATVAGIINAAAAAGMIAAGYGFLRVSEVWGWRTVTALWIVLSVISILLLLVILPKFLNFKKL